MTTSENRFYRLNDCPPPSDFDVDGALEISERFVNDTLGGPPDSRPRVDIFTKYIHAPGPSRYILEKKAHLGMGGFSSVHKGWDRRLGKYVAIKILYTIPPVNPLDGESFELEAKIMARISHPGVPEIYDFNTVVNGNGDESPAIIMELIDAENLADRVYGSKRPSLEVEGTTEIIRQIASTLDYIDGLGFHHGDISAKNILLAQPHIKIVDFGNSDWANPSGVRAVSFGYTAPEFLEGAVSLRSDEYSLAAIAYVVLFHQTPPEEYSMLKTDYYRTNPFYDMDDRSMDKMFNLFQKALSPNPADRFGSCSEFAHEFGKIFKNAKLKILDLPKIDTYNSDYA